MTEHSSDSANVSRTPDPADLSLDKDTLKDLDSPADAANLVGGLAPEPSFGCVTPLCGTQITTITGARIN